MIVRMKKIAVIVRQTDATAALEKLRGLGVVHLEHQQPLQSDRINKVREDIALLDTALEALVEFGLPAGPCSDGKARQMDWKLVAKHIVDLWKRREQLEDYSRYLRVTIGRWEPWGDFDPAAFKKLADQGIFVRLFEVPVTEIKNFPAGLAVETLRKSKGKAFCVAVSREPIAVPFKELELPKMSLAQMKVRLAEEERVLQTIIREATERAAYRHCFTWHKKRMEEELQFYEALAGMGQSPRLRTGAAGILAYVRGYVPIDAVEPVGEAARLQQWGILLEDPQPDDPVPTLIRSPRWVQLLTPVVRMLGILPGYHELDTSPLFLIFLCAFFGILIQDAGYGLIYFGLTMWLQKKMAARLKDKDVFYLCYVLSGCAIIWGVLTGTFFGQQWLLRFGVRGLAPQLNDATVMQSLCFFIGALHLTIAHAWRAVLKFPSPAALAEIGWSGVLWAAFMIARTLILSVPFPEQGKWLAGAGIALVVFFTNPQKNIFKAVGSGLVTVVTNLMNNFTDVVSYVRLFAVGLAGLAIAETANAMAAGLGNGIMALVGGALIMVIGHGLNVLLGPMSVLVHGVRLNILEFSGHANVTWSGFAYRPLEESPL